MHKLGRFMLWLLVSLIGAASYALLAFKRGEHINSLYLLTAALCTYVIGYRFYSRWIAARILALDDRRAPPAEVHDDGRDFVRTNRWIVFGHHFAAISGPGPLVGPVLAAQFGYLPGTLWILIGVVLGGAVQDFVILFCSMRRDGRSLGQMVRDEIGTTAGFVASIAILAIMAILLAVLALVVVKALAESPWGVFTVGATIPIALFMGGYLRFWRIGRVLEASALGVIMLLAAVWAGQFAHTHPSWSRVFTLNAETLAWSVIAYGLAASILPVWLLLAPRDYLSTFMKLGTIFALVAGVFIVLPDLKMPALSRFADGTGLVVAGSVFPFCFITIACGAISGFHTLIASGTTPKMITREGYARSIGYGAMCLESLVAIMAMVAACTLEPGIYLSMNIKGVGATPAEIAAHTVATVNAAGFPVTVDQMNHLADQIGENTLFGRTGGAATLAVGMAKIFSQAVSDRWLDLWYHFAIMFEALFILTTLDAGTRVGRYLLQDLLGNVWKPLGNTAGWHGNVLSSLLMVGAWGYFLIQGVRDPLGGINSLWPLFGIANQMLAAIALCLATTVLLKMQLQPRSPANHELMAHASPAGRPLLALITFIPLVWLLSVTFTAGYQKILHPDPRIGFLAQARALEGNRPKLEQALESARRSDNAAAISAAERAWRTNRTLRFNNLLDAFVAALFLALAAAVVWLSLREWWALLRRLRPPTLRETDPVWLPAYAVAESGSSRWAAWLAIAFALPRELTGQSAFDHARSQVARPTVQLADATLLPAAPAAPARDDGVRSSQHPSVQAHDCCEGVHGLTHVPVHLSTHPSDPASKTAGDSHVPDDLGRLYAQMVERRYQGPCRCC